MPRYTPDLITHLEPHQIFVFGSNTQGRHGAGAAKQAMRFGAVYGQAKGRQGKAYAIPTKDLSKGARSLPLPSIQEDIEAFIDYTCGHLGLEFLVTPIGCGLAGYKPEEIAIVFWRRFGRNLESLPSNIVLPKIFY